MKQSSDSHQHNFNRRLAEMSSLWGDGAPVYSRYRWLETCCIRLNRWKYKLTHGLWFDVKFALQRLCRGYTDLDTYNAAWYIARKAIPVLTAMSNRFMGTSIKWHAEDRFGEIIELTRDQVFLDDNNMPAAFTETEWKDILNDIIFAFQYTLDQDVFDDAFDDVTCNKRHKRYKRGLRLFSIYYGNLWD